MGRCDSCDPTNPSELRRASWLSFDAAFGTGWSTFTPGAARACVAHIRRVTGEQQVCRRTTHHTMATCGGVGGRVTDGADSPVAVGLWCRDSTGWFLPVMSQKRHMLPLFSGLTLFLAFAVHRRSWRGPRPTWLCGSFSGQTKPGSQSLTHMVNEASA